MVRLPLVLIATALAGCTSAADRVVPTPTDVTLQGALVEVVQAFRAAQAESHGTGTPIGLYPCSVTVTFNVTAGGSSGNQVVLDASVRPPARVVDGTFGLTATTEQTQTASRGNQIVVLLTSAACNPPNTLGTLRPQATLAGSGRPRPLFIEPSIAGTPTPEEAAILGRIFREMRRRAPQN